MGRISATIEIARSSWKVLKADKELMVLPVLSGLASAIIAASFLLPLIGATDGELEGASYVLLFVMYVVLSYVTIFFNAALVSAAHERLSGGDPTVGSALRGAALRAGKILPWALVSATVSIVLRAIEERGGALGRIVAGLAGMAWSVVTFLVLPIIVIEGLGVGDAIKGSGRLFKRTWGENVAAQVGFSILGLVAVLPAIVVGVAAGSAGLWPLVVVAVAWVVLVAIVIATLSGIFQTALYHYATKGSVPGDFYRDDAFSGAFAPRRRRDRGIPGF
ncbi:MAG: DUF6159 family protein [Acidimicrobiia bacterium]